LKKDYFEKTAININNRETTSLQMGIFCFFINNDKKVKVLKKEKRGELL
jgi:hypothetical protein